MARNALVLLLPALLAPALVQAQDFNAVTRRAYPFFQRDLTVEVRSAGAGELQLLRGGIGRVEVASRAPFGLAGSGLGGFHGDRLSLTAAGADTTRYLVVVPENVRVRLLLPDHDYPEPAGAGETATYAWKARADREKATTAAGLAIEPLPPLYTVFTGETPAERVAVPDLSTVRRLAVRVEGDVFRIETSLPMSLTPGVTDRIEIRAMGQPLDVVIIHLPAGTRTFQLDAGGSPALRIVNGRIDVLCSPVIHQVLAGDRHWVDFTPSDGTLICAR